MFLYENLNTRLCKLLPGSIMRCNARRRYGVLLVSLLLFLLGNVSLAASETTSPQEYQIKAAFLYTITKFVEWPASGNTAQSPTLNIAILGQDPFGANLEPIKGKTARGRTIVFKHFRRVEDVKDCDVVFISASEKGRLARILKHLQSSPVLTVADQDGFCEAGGMINLITVKNRVVLEINVAAARRAQLTISSQLLKLAKIVTE